MVTTIINEQKHNRILSNNPTQLVAMIDSKMDGIWGVHECTSTAPRRGSPPTTRELAHRMIKQLRQLETALMVTEAGNMDVHAHPLPPPDRYTDPGALQHRDPAIFYPSPIPIAYHERLAYLRTRVHISYCYQLNSSAGRTEVFNMQAQHCAADVRSLEIELRVLLCMAPPVTLGESPVSSSSSAAPPPVFHPFPRLPAELRLLIWELASVPPTCPHLYRAAQRLQSMADARPYAHSSDPPPATLLMPDRGLMRANKEAYYETRRIRNETKKVLKSQARRICIEVYHPTWYTDSGLGILDSETDNDDGDDGEEDAGWGDEGEEPSQGNDSHRGYYDHDDSDALKSHFHRLSDFNLSANRLRRRLAELQKHFPGRYEDRMGQHGQQLIEDLFNVGGVELLS
ncbi:hypothetical protein SPBR_00723 [Sporothrix brasiliensis 5110]|uniref:2EXR domain-containing protein n=1 Tax=Sporothrix brasiliensis 5110 TaxID=1398154 RepID=A0A0C2ILQ2_9PEZI|nr:uncharacterized protein SPBR_00723 [Sporothrix brasiliensis 5110]KIH90016.1 hypothetical protein SPBR_00723 [Sporothrix brasiliensis 5110]